MFNKDKNNDELETTVDEVEAIEKNYAPTDLEESYKPVSQLFIPEEAKQFYKERGFDLQWVRINVPNSQGQMDLKNIQKKEADRYEFVLRKDVPGLSQSMTGFFGDKISNGDHGLYIVGDVALAKFPLARKEAKRAFLRRRTEARSQAIIKDLKKNNLLPNKDADEKIEIFRDSPKSNNSKKIDFGD